MPIVSEDRQVGDKTHKHKGILVAWHKHEGF